MDFAEAKSHAMGVIFDTDYFSRSITYTPNGAAPVLNMPANILYGISSERNNNYRGDGSTWHLMVERDLRSDFRHSSIRRVAMVAIRASDIPLPEYRDTMEFDGEIWTVTEIYDA